MTTDMCTYGHRTGMCIYSHKLRATTQDRHVHLLTQAAGDKRYL